MTDKAGWVEIVRRIISHSMDALIIVGAVSWIWIDNANWPARLFWSALVCDVAFGLIFDGIKRRATESSKKIGLLK